MPAQVRDHTRSAWSGRPSLHMSVVPSGPGVGAATSGSPTSSTPTRKLKLSSVVDPTLDAEIQHMDAKELERLYTDYRTKYGAHPSQDVDPTADQLSGLQQLIKASALPYADLSVWVWVEDTSEAGVHLVHPQRLDW